MLVPQKIIEKKAQGLALTSEEIKSFFSGYMGGEITDYQCSALLMAIRLNGMNTKETASLTEIIVTSGQPLQWNEEKTKIVDKHSTGGVGDKTSLILVPLCHCDGLYTPMIAGRGLGHTGGTIDKLEAIPGCTTTLSTEAMLKQFHSIGGFIVGQSDKLAPLDKKLYALRDVTATVRSIPLITASILSKKISEGLGSLVMDVKVGSGAFMQDQESAKQLGKTLQEVAQLFGLKLTVFITNMDSPLGRSAGNLLEIEECCDILQGQGPDDTKELSIELAAKMIAHAYPTRSRESIISSLEKYLSDGRAWKAFCHLIGAQGGDLVWLENRKLWKKAKFQIPLESNMQGYIHGIDVEALGLAIVAMGGGRKKLSDTINHRVGLSGLKHYGEAVEKGEPLAIIHTDDEKTIPQVEAMLRSAYRLNKEPCDKKRLIIEQF